MHSLLIKCKIPCSTMSFWGFLMQHLAPGGLWESVWKLGITITIKWVYPHKYNIRHCSVINIKGFTDASLTRWISFVPEISSFNGFGAGNRSLEWWWVMLSVWRGGCIDGLGDVLLYYRLLFKFCFCVSRKQSVGAVDSSWVQLVSFLLLIFNTAGL